MNNFIFTTILIILLILPSCDSSNNNSSNTLKDSDYEEATNDLDTIDTDTINDTDTADNPDLDQETTDIDENHLTDDDINNTEPFDTEQCNTLLTAEQPIGSINGTIGDIFIKDEYLFSFPEASYRIDIYKIKEDETLESIKSIEIKGTPVKLQGDKLFANNWEEQTLYIYNISEYLTLEEYAKVHCEDTDLVYFHDLYIKDNYLYMIKSDNESSTGPEFTIFDISNLSSPTKLGSYHMYGYKFFIKDKYALIETDERLILLDVSDGNDIKELTLNIEQSGGAITLYDNYLYIGETWNTHHMSGLDENTQYYLKSFDITNPENIIEKDSILLDHSISELRFGGDYLVSGNKVYNVKDPENITLIGAVPISTSFEGIARKDNRLFYAYKGSINSTKILETNELTELKPLVYTISQVLDYTIDNNLAYLIEEDKSFSIYDISDPNAPRFINAVNSDWKQSTALALNKETKVLYVLFNYTTEYNYIKTFDVSNPYDIKPLKEFNIENSYVVDLAISNNKLFFTYGNGKDNPNDIFSKETNFGVKMADISNPDNINIITELNLYNENYAADSSNQLKVKDDTIYVAGERFYIVKFTNTALNLRYANNLYGNINEMFIDEKYAFITFSGMGSSFSSEIINDTTGGGTYHFSSFYKDAFSGIWKKNNTLFIASSKGLQLFNINDNSSDIHYLGYYAVKISPLTHIYLDDNYIYLFGNGIKVLKQENMNFCTLDQLEECGDSVFCL